MSNNDSDSGDKRGRKLAGCIPCTEDGKWVLMVTSRTNPDKLIFPKGGVEKKEKFEDAAIRETFEEAGVRGTVREGPIEISDIHWFELVVTEEYSDWPERLERERRWGKVEDFINHKEEIAGRMKPVLKYIYKKYCDV